MNKNLVFLTAFIALLFFSSIAYADPITETIGIVGEILFLPLHLLEGVVEFLF